MNGMDMAPEVRGLVDALERDLTRAAQRRISVRRSRRRRSAIAGVVSIGLLVSVSAASAVSGSGPIADLLGIRGDDPSLLDVAPTDGGARYVVSAESAAGETARLGVFEADRGIGGPRPGAAVPAVEPAARPGAQLCFGMAWGDGDELGAISCGDKRAFVRNMEADGMHLHASGAGGTGPVRTDAVWGLVPAAVETVTIGGPGLPPLRAELSEPMRLGSAGDSATTIRAFFALPVLPADEHLTGSYEIIARAERADGTAVSAAAPTTVSFPVAADWTRPADGRNALEMPLAIDGWEWTAAFYEGREGTLCTLARPRGSRAFHKCFAPLPVIDGVTASGFAAFPSEVHPMGTSRQRGSYVVQGVVPAETSAVAIVDQRDRRWEATLSDGAWTTAQRRPDDLGTVTGSERDRLAELPSSLPLKAFAVAIPTPPWRGEGRGLRVEVETAP